MTDDIVTRLREYHPQFAPTDFDLAQLIEDGAYEIERLRKEVAYYKSPCPRCDYKDEE